MHRPAWVEIDLNALSHNVSAIKKMVGPQVKIMGIVKADAYGHGDYEVSRVLLNHGVEMLGIAILEEGIQLRNKGIEAPLFLLGGIFEDQIDAVIQYNLIPAVYDLKLAEALSKRAHYYNRVINAHVYVDTGMGSIGVKYDGAVEFIRSLQAMKNLFIGGIYTHCSCSDEKESVFTNLQIKRFKDVLAALGAIMADIPLKHMANSGAIIGHPDAYFTMVRPGLSLYGLYPSEEVSRNIGIRPVMSFKTRVIHIKDMKPGDVVGYSGTYRVTKPTRVATLPFGYDDGYNRLLSSKGKVIIRGTQASIIGRVCMDQCFVDVTNIKGVSVGDEVVVYGSQGQETISIESVAKQLNTIPYEVTCAVSKRVPRIYINHEEK
ncbi:MAG: alanine racemase [Candidatus Brocadia sp. AMX2]|uniref:Alanine racemase n=1 Tax=Candidatus Brocadia sinica JPN1 TaxID=1197129 RepID=A0ABQ0JUK2_9BACT|nr:MULTISPECIES: alanine racemase [Brocadia]KXK25161.1 MAG: alanine racemase [Candidatus Brocadia sinica]MBC6934002.1 alanine racemase [Candidatus Brocadia sp.]MBL1170219.1 alanine racemase [Candidatus Brocadia sp. AMX1]NOG41727.1 alanine racemase [Planctomycetota bacterium]KAA0241834.1 MAG: alanine racemase [Candidatus Brocadia sp. AMX2]